MTKGRASQITVTLSAAAMRVLRSVRVRRVRAEWTHDTLEWPRAVHVELGEDEGGEQEPARLKVEVGHKIELAEV